MIFCYSDQEKIRVKMKKDRVDHFVVEENDRCISFCWDILLYVPISFYYFFQYHKQ
jgi:hypothetical protein